MGFLGQPPSPPSNPWLINYRSGSRVTFNTTGICPTPAGVTVGDVLIAHVWANLDTVNLTGPPGWVRQARVTQVATGQSGGTGAYDDEVWTLVAGLSEPANYTWGNLGGRSLDITIDAYIGVDPAVLDVPIVSSSTGSTFSQATVASITTVSPNAWVVCLVSNDQLVGTCTPPAGTTSRQAVAAGNLASADYPMATPGASGSKFFQLGNNAMSTTHAIALRPRVAISAPVPTQSPSAPAVTTGQTIQTAGITVSRVVPAAPITGAILQPGTYPGQPVTVVNSGLAANSITFAAQATSNVADGSASPIPGLTGRSFVWVAAESLWYRTG